MKRLLFVVLVSGLIYSCGGGSESSESTSDQGGSTSGEGGSGGSASGPGGSTSGEGGSNSGQATSAQSISSTSSSTGGPLPSCVAGSSCECGDLVSKTVCEDDVELCDCDDCPDFEPAPAPSFEPCGGEPFGRWRLVSSDWSGYAVPFEAGGSCALHGTEEVGEDDIRFEFRSGGDAAFTQLGAHLTFRTGPNCGGCDELQGVRATLDCISAGCGACDCDFDIDPIKLEGTWSRTETTLRFASEGYARIDLDYCVEGEQLTLRDEQGRVMTLAKTGAEGTPTACELRNEETCTLGGGCRLGACEGSTSCTDASSESACGVISGCSWNPETCTGTAKESCELQDYDVTPGCSFNGNTACEGTRIACPEIQDDDVCEQSPGCTVEPGCTGGSRNCSFFNGSKSGCERYAGCEWEDPSYCVGTFQCEDIFWSTCESLSFDCVETNCAGDAAPCSDLTTLECEVAAGCVPTAP